MSEEKKKSKRRPQLYDGTHSKDEFPFSPEDSAKLTRNGTNHPMQPAIPEDRLQRTNQFGTQLMNMYIESNANQDVEFLMGQVQKFLDLCQQYDQRVTNQGFYYAMGWYPTRVADIAAGKKGQELALFLQTIQSYCSLLREQYMANSDIPVPVGIFWQKNYDGFKDTDHAPITINISERKSLNQLAQEVIEFDDYDVDND